jgi:hypothetical protein
VVARGQRLENDSVVAPLSIDLSCNKMTRR